MFWIVDDVHAVGESALFAGYRKVCEKVVASSLWCMLKPGTIFKVRVLVTGR